MLENLQDLQGLECETAAGDKSQTEYFLLVLFCAAHALRCARQLCPVVSVPPLKTGGRAG
jgi:hypothetical protein